MNIVKRALFGSIYVILIVVSLLTWESSKTFFNILFACFIGLGMLEASKLLNHDGKPIHKWITVIDCAGGVGMFIAARLSWIASAGSLLLIAIALYLLVRFSVQLYMPHHNAVACVRQSLASVFYVALPLAMLNALIAKFSPQLALAVFIFIWLYDTGAFLVGCAIGKHRLFERISPKKSWEGVAGGAAFVIAFAIAISCIPALNAFFNPQSLSIDTWIVMGITAVVAATLGDLFESLLKRTAGVKDSGNIIPGHGGILDRIDSLLFVAPAIFVVLEFVEIIHKLF
ncbi:MAG: phosphatidate cytidylyltransferase [Muribaculaceae bacterium]|nr:phosphatidate cytidylyltransferase [Muribaculaceae bacterium]MBR0023541.1 phosphatidate cytidylyltransferase [Muribaculaceae bacterium]